MALVQMAPAYYLKIERKSCYLVDSRTSCEALLKHANLVMYV